MIADDPGKERTRLRIMVPQDVERVLAIARASFRNPWQPRHFLHEIQSNPFARNVVLTRGGDVVAYASCWSLHGEWKINDLAVAPGWRRRGLGRELLQRLLSAARDEDCRLATLEVREGNRAAQKLYAGAGFVEYGRRRHYYPAEGEDAILMQAELA